EWNDDARGRRGGMPAGCRLSDQSIDLRGGAAAGADPEHRVGERRGRTYGRAGVRSGCAATQSRCGRARAVARPYEPGTRRDGEGVRRGSRVARRARGCAARCHDGDRACERRPTESGQLTEVESHVARGTAAVATEPANRPSRSMRWTVRLGSWLIRLLGLTWRIRVVHGAKELAELRRRGQPIVYSLWHGDMLPLLYQHRGEGVAVLISEHRDGELIAGIAQRLGFRTVRGSTSRGA